MIILDTNQLRKNRTLDTTAIAMLVALSGANGQTLALPGLVVEEFIAYYERELRTELATLSEAVRQLRTLYPAYSSPIVPPDESFIISATQNLGVRLRGIFDTLAFSERDAKLALIRETRRKRPASTDGDNAGRGARDVAIWLSAIEASRSEKVYFVSNDTKAFGKDGRLFPELAAEVATVGGDLEYLNDVAELLKVLGTPRTPPMDTETLAMTYEVRDATQVALTDPMLYFELLNHLPIAYRTGSNFASTSVQLALVGADSPTAYRVGERSWLSVRLQWEAVKSYSFLGPDGGLAFEGAVLFRVWTTVLVEYDENDALQAAQVVARGHVNVLRAVPLTES